MLGSDGSMRIWLCTEPTDMRKSYNGLSAMVKQRLGTTVRVYQSPQNTDKGAVF